MRGEYSLQDIIAIAIHSISELIGAAATVMFGLAVSRDGKESRFGHFNVFTAAGLAALLTMIWCSGAAIVCCDDPPNTIAFIQTALLSITELAYVKIVWSRSNAIVKRVHPKRFQASSVIVNYVIPFVLVAQTLISALYSISELGLAASALEFTAGASLFLFALFDLALLLVLWKFLSRWDLSDDPELSLVAKYGRLAAGIMLIPPILLVSLGFAQAENDWNVISGFAMMSYAVTWAVLVRMKFRLQAISQKDGQKSQVKNAIADGAFRLAKSQTSSIRKEEQLQSGISSDQSEGRMSFSAHCDSKGTAWKKVGQKY
ncbi:hypothetical protein HDU84_002670 [Entophlyctis sp. JEL0112]|nr:hypothetical protein HDU84_002670 [Entophlyctis sp. JEL0112]